ncbi:MAG: peptidyl-prolyl cis-trans isomerase [Gemmatimonadetes bacterium]|nr:peptidyl-prolyl cis-trans isomerase [Gemmatimonadota bacterium]
MAFPACREAFTSDVSVVARAGANELTVDRLAEIFAQGKALVVRRDVIERVAHLWVDYSLFAAHSVGGDSMLDSATVVHALWPEVQQRLADHFHDGLVAARVGLDSARVDSAYTAGEYRLLKHILIRTEPTLAPPARDAKRRLAEAIRARLRNGGSWAEANRRNDDQRAKANGGSLGVIVRGEMPAQFENVAFALRPGETSDVVESPLGFHVIVRPRLRDERTAFAAGVEDRVVERMDSAYLAQLGERRHLRVTRDAPAAVRAALADPIRAAGSRRVIGTFDGGRFTVGDLIRWIQAMPGQVQQQVSRADDGQLSQFIRQLMRNQALMVEAESAGVQLTPLDLEEFAGLLRRDLDQLRQALAIDGKALPPDSGGVEARQRVAALHVDQYLEAVAENRTRFVSVPPFLAMRLRERTPWRVVPAGIDRVLERGRELRAMVDSLRPPQPPPATTDTLAAADSGGANGRR